MAKYYRAGNYLWIKAIEENGVYKLLFSERKFVAVATKHSKKAHAEEVWNYYDREFTSKERANRYFKKVKENNPNLRHVTLSEYQAEC